MRDTNLARISDDFYVSAAALERQISNEIRLPCGASSLPESPQSLHLCAS